MENGQKMFTIPQVQEASKILYVTIHIKKYIKSKYWLSNRKSIFMKIVSIQLFPIAALPSIFLRENNDEFINW